MNTALISLALQLAISIVENDGPVSEALTKAHSEGRGLTPEEVAALVERANAARAKLLLDIGVAKAAGR